MRRLQMGNVQRISVLRFETKNTNSPIAENRRYVFLSESQIRKPKLLSRMSASKMLLSWNAIRSATKTQRLGPEHDRMADSPLISIATRLTCDHRRFIETQRELNRFIRETASGIRSVKVNKGQWLKVEKASYPSIYAMFDRHSRRRSSGGSSNDENILFPIGRGRDAERFRKKMSDIMRNRTLITDILWPKHLNHLLRKMSAERDNYLRILRRSDQESTTCKLLN
ncbi:hypothetical protein M3Y98_00097500 [Aphelenchoides besseyi]|nr:hypothetical protein M3Y98_00097500 [Aphelenchoides besseyi]KAI6198578.1 hypothetical protein M3Y96_00534100 [Aphelenchoides besseyi]